ncbi:MAG TPA: tetratricopeptide repeat protein [Rhodobacteraceae bacterium]|nr:tetratricopeptide repeat protein [Paracoccaceae bacterium]
MSETDSFIEEVSEEVRRDRLFALMRKYGWIALLAVLLIVGGAAYNEWNKARERARAEALGDQLLSALEQGDAKARLDALAKIQDGSPEAKALTRLLMAAASQNADDKDAALAALKGVEQESGLPQAYRDLATLKLVLLAGTDMPVAERREKLQTIAVGGAPFRLLASEQLAMLDLEEGDKDAAISRLRDIVNDVEVTSGLRDRASQMIVVLGGEPEAS